MAAVGSRLAARRAAPMFADGGQDGGGICLVRTLPASSLYVTSRTQWMLFSIDQCSRDQGCRRLVVVIDRHVRDGVNDFFATCPPNWLTASAGARLRS